MFKKFLPIIVLVGVILAVLYHFSDPGQFVSSLVERAGQPIGAAFFSLGITVDELINRYADKDVENPKKIRILIVPGHEPGFGGAEYRNLKERDLNLQLALRLRSLLINNPKFDVYLSRDLAGWDPTMAKYVYDNNQAIKAWVLGMKREMYSLVSKGKITLVKGQVGHNVAPVNSALFLYGINKWSAENNIDIALHIHINDNVRNRNGFPSFEGFSIYVPESQYSNSASSKILADDLFSELINVHKISTLPGENGGVVEDQELIALGSHNTSDSLSVLIEYGYIYEPFMQSVLTRNAYFDRMASSTAIAINKFFESRI